MSSREQERPLIGALLRVCWQEVRARIHADISAKGFEGISPAHLAVFQYPAPRGKRITELAARAGMSRQALTYLIRELEGAGYLERKPDPADRRATLVDLTERGELAVRTIRASVRRIEREWARELGERRFEEVRDALLALAEGFQRV
jgi:DNA-binding MarR family transcriptional regulator